MGKCICIKQSDVDREITKQAWNENSLMSDPTQPDTISSDRNKINNPSMSPSELSKTIFNKLNEIRFNPLLFTKSAKEHGLEEIILKANSLKNKPELAIWSESKYNILSNFDIKDTAFPLLTKNKYKATVYKHISNKPNIDGVVWDLLASSKKEDQERILIKNYHHCIVSAFKTYEKGDIKIDIILVFLELKKRSLYNNN